MPTIEIENRLDSLTGWVTAGLCFIVVFAISVMGLMFWFALQSSHQAGDIQGIATETHTALCAFKQDLEVRHAANLQILREHPEDPVSVFNLVIPRATLRSSVDSQKQTLDSLVSLDC